jgi:hypothetical protein
MNNINLPRNTIKRIIQDNTSYEVSGDAIDYLTDFLKDIVENITIQASNVMDDENNIRKQTSLRERKRIDLSTYKSLLAELIKVVVDLRLGKVGQYNRETTLSSEATKEVIE